MNKHLLFKKLADNSMRGTRDTRAPATVQFNNPGAPGRQRSRLPGESGRTMVALCGCTGVKGFAGGWGKRDKGESKAFNAVVLHGCRAKAKCGKEA